MKKFILTLKVMKTKIFFSILFSSFLCFACSPNNMSVEVEDATTKTSERDTTKMIDPQPPVFLPNDNDDNVSKQDTLAIDPQPPVIPSNDNDDNVSEQDILEIQFSDYPLTAHFQAEDFYKNEVIVINSYEELNNIFQNENSSYPEIDFSKHTLLFAAGRTTSGVHSIKKQLFQISPNEYILFVDIGLNMTTVAQKWIVLIETEKLPPNSNVRLNINQVYL